MKSKSRYLWPSNVQVHIVAWLARYVCMASMVGPGYIICGWLVPSVQLYDFISIVCLIPFAHTHARSPITFVCTCIFPWVLCVLHECPLHVTCNTHLIFGWCVPYKNQNLYLACLWPLPSTHVGTRPIQSTLSFKKLTKMVGNLAAWFLYSGWSWR